jgi:hypothetical protein
MLHNSCKTTSRILVKFGNSTHPCCSVQIHNSGAMCSAEQPSLNVPFRIQQRINRCGNLRAGQAILSDGFAKNLDGTSTPVALSAI